MKKYISQRTIKTLFIKSVLDRVLYISCIRYTFLQKYKRHVFFTRSVRTLLEGNTPEVYDLQFKTQKASDKFRKTFLEFVDRGNPYPEIIDNTILLPVRDIKIRVLLSNCVNPREYRDNQRVTIDKNYYNPYRGVLHINAYASIMKNKEQR